MISSNDHYFFTVPYSSWGCPPSTTPFSPSVWYSACSWSTAASRIFISNSIYLLISLSSIPCCWCLYSFIRVCFNRLFSFSRVLILYSKHYICQFCFYYSCYFLNELCFSFVLAGDSASSSYSTISSGCFEDLGVNTSKSDSVEFILYRSSCSSSMLIFLANLVILGTFSGFLFFIVTVLSPPTMIYA